MLSEFVRGRKKDQQSSLSMRVQRDGCVQRQPTVPQEDRAHQKPALQAP